METDESVRDEVHVAHRLEDECPWEGCAKVMTHNGWLDVVEAIKAMSPEAYAALRRDLLK